MAENSTDCYLSPLDLDPAPTRKVGWPWDRQGKLPLRRQFVNTDWPRISIVTPSFNQAAFLEETIRSVLLQDYPNLEYIIIDGGSSDGSVEIIRKYEPWLAYWVSEPDPGFIHAINKGIKKSTGEIISWLNSDDTYFPGVLNTVRTYLIFQPGTQVLYGDALFVDSEGKKISYFKSHDFIPPSIFFDHFIPQPASFIRRSIFDQVGLLNEDLKFALDYDLWMRIVNRGRLNYIPELWATYRIHSASKSSREQVFRWEDSITILINFFRREDIPSSWHKYYSESLSHAHWQTAIEYYRLHDDEKALKHIICALEIKPNSYPFRLLSHNLVGSVADRMNEELFNFIDGFFSLIPKSRQITIAHRKSRARLMALLSINPKTPYPQSRKYARDAIKLDRYWVSNRFVLKTAMFSPLCSLSRL